MSSKVYPQIFRAYDIRGIYPDQLNEHTAYKIGAAFALFLSSHFKIPCSRVRVVTGRDARTSSPSLFNSFTQGVIEQGAHVIDIGMVSTDILYFAPNYLKREGGAMISASHNPPEYNGVKMLAKGPEFLSGDWGIPQIKKMVIEQEFEKAKKPGKIIHRDIIPEYIQYVLSLVDMNDIKRMKVVVDAGNGMGSLAIRELVGKIPIDLICLYCDPDGTFPNHPPDPLIIENTFDLQKAVVRNKADFGLALDGDGDRTIFVDELGNTLGGDMIVALFAKYFLKQYPGSAIVYNLTCSRAVPEIIYECGGKPIRSRTGHGFMKKAAEENKAIVGGEISGHITYKDTFYAESGILTLLTMLTILSQSGKPLSELIRPLQRYHKVGEINFKIKDREGAIEKLAKKYSQGRQDRLDGLTVELDNWWFNVRSSNTEPLLRIVIEADNKKFAEEKLKQIKKIIKE
ncbi:phosphomannomutase/phosphoglucomutase [Patescibacteria group bacterium AH-259-L05]|nr:phosphomannomutase/phosphoglucomutase [Patescibacteria group bacterium AH-259-L05]